MTQLPEYGKRFVQFAVRRGLLRFGEFVTKSGRSSPYFFNTGACADGSSLYELGGYYAAAIADHFEHATLLLGPSYKGITLSAAAAIALSKKRVNPVGFCFDRKERKDHGEGGLLIGQIPTPGDHVVIVDDVITDGKSKRQAIKLLEQETGIHPTGLIVAVDRQERGSSNLSALEELSSELDLPTTAIATISQIVDLLSREPVDKRLLIDIQLRDRIKSYVHQYAPK